MANAQFVMMPVKCLGKICINCPNLKVDNNVSEMILHGLGDDTMYQNENLLYCRGYRRCLKIKQMMEEEND